MAELMSVFRETRDIDDALMQVYGFDQYGLDSEWRGTQGLEPLPPPAQMERELVATQTPEPTETPAEPPAEPVVTATSEPVETPTAQPTALPTPAASLEDTAGPALPQGCGVAPAYSGGRIAPDLAMLALLAGPLGLALVRGPFLWRRDKRS